MAARGGTRAVTKASLKAAAKEAGKEALKEGAIHGLAMALAALRKKMSGQPAEPVPPAPAPPPPPPQQAPRDRWAGFKEAGRAAFDVIEGKAPNNAKEITAMLRGFKASYSSEPASSRGQAGDDGSGAGGAPPVSSGAGSSGASPGGSGAAAPPASSGGASGSGGSTARPSGGGSTPPGGSGGGKSPPSPPSPGGQPPSRRFSGLAAVLGVLGLDALFGASRKAANTTLPGAYGRDRFLGLIKSKREGLFQAFNPRAQTEKLKEGWENLKTIPGRVVKGLVALTVGLFTGAKAAEGFGKRVLEGQRDLRRFNSSIANTFAKLDRQDLVLAARKAASTSGTTRTLANQYMSLRSELAPITNSMANVVNLVATGVVLLGRLATFGTKVVGTLTGISAAIDFVAWLFGDKKGGDQSPFKKFLQQAAAGDFAKPKNQPPQKN